MAIMAKSFRQRLAEIFGFDLRSLALFRIALALVVLVDLSVRFSQVTAHYSGLGVLPLGSLSKVSASPFYWSIFALSDSVLVQSILFIVAIAIALLLLIGYHTRLATIATWALIVSLHHRNPLLLFAADDVIRAVLFWAMFLPLGACYSVESALNTNPNPLPKRVVSAATVAFMIQVCYIYMWSDDQYGTAFAGFLLSLPPQLLEILTFSALIFEWVGPLLIFIPFRNSLFKIVAILSFILLHIGFGLSFHLGIFPFLSVTHWLPIIPSLVWDWGQKRMRNPEREGLRINYDRDCGFCKKVVHLLRTFLILPGTPLLVAQDNPSIYEDMVAQNSWVVYRPLWPWEREFMSGLPPIVVLWAISPNLSSFVP